MSKITGFWKRSLRPTFFNNIRRFGGVHVPRMSLSVRQYAEDCAGTPSPACRLVSLPKSEPDHLPPHEVSGDLAAVERVLSQIESPEIRAQYESQLHGVVHREVEDCVAVIEQGRVTHDSGIVIAPDDRLLDDVSPLGFTLDLPTNPFRLKYLPRPWHVPGCLAVVTSKMTYNYYHWLMDTLPRLDLYQRAGVAADRFYVPIRYPFQRQSLNSLSIPRSQVVAASCNRHVTADRLVVSSVRFGHPSRTNADFLFQRLTRGVCPEGAPPLRVFISRRGRGKRVIVNEDEVFRLLAPMGFRRYDLETTPFAQQVAIFHQAECIVGSHGAGLTNIVFCRPGTKVLEVGTPYRPYPCFYEIAHYRQLDYRLYMASPVNVRHFDPGNGDGDSDMLVCSSDFRQFVADALP